MWDKSCQQVTQDTVAAVLNTGGKFKETRSMIQATLSATQLFYIHSYIRSFYTLHNETELLVTVRETLTFSGYGMS
jgi:hypothetical protein